MLHIAKDIELLSHGLGAGAGEGEMEVIKRCKCIYLLCQLLCFLRAKVGVTPGNDIVSLHGS